MLTDYHTHTPLCHHAEGEPEAYIDRAIALGLIEYGISDHAPNVPEPFDDWRMLRSDLPQYFEWINRAKKHAAERIKVRAGLECDWLKGCEPWIEELSGEYSWDYLIGSVHYIGDKWDFDNPKWLGRWAEGDVESFWQMYWKAYLEMVKANLFDFYGHPDLVKKFRFFPKSDLRSYYEPVIQALADQKACIELNTAGLRKDCKEWYPSDVFLKLAAEAGLMLTITSDAHHPAEVGYAFDSAVKTAESLGFSGLTYFKQREKTLVPWRSVEHA